MSIHAVSIRKICSHSPAKQAYCLCSYYFFYGRQHRFSVDAQIGHHVADVAVIWAEYVPVWRQAIDDGSFVKRAPVSREKRTSGGVTLADFSVAYVEECSMPSAAGKELKDEHHRDYYTFQPLLAFEYEGTPLGERPFTQVTQKMYDAYIADRRDEGYAASTVNKDVTLIKAMVDWGVEQGYFGPAGKSPLNGKSKTLKRKDINRRQRPITDAMLEAMKHVADPLLWAYIELALITCMRLCELYRLRWCDVEGLQLKITPKATGAASAHRKAPLDDRGVAILDWLRIDPDGKPYPATAYVFGLCGEPPTEITDRFNTMLLKAFPARDPQGEALPIEWTKGVHGPAARQRLEEIDISFSDFRHEGALRKYRAGWLLNDIQRVLGHSTLVQTSTYLGVGDEETLKAMSTLGAGAKVFGSTDGKTKNYQTLPNGGVKPGPKKGAKQDLTH